MPDVPVKGTAEQLIRDRIQAASRIETVRLRLEQAQSLAILRHPRLARLRAAHGLADAADVRARTRPDPELSLTELWIVPEAVLGVVASLRWELLPVGTQDARHGLAAALRQSVDARIASEEWRLAQDVRIAWLQVARDERALALAERARSLANDTREFGHSMLERGATTEVETSILDVELAEAEREIVARRGALDAHRQGLAEAIGLPPGVRVDPLADSDPLEPLEARIPPGEPDTLILERLPELREARASYLLAERELEAAHLGALAKVSVGPDAQHDATSTYLGGGLTTTLPISDKNRAGILEAETRRAQAGLAFTEALFTARAALAKARAEEDAAARALAIHETRVAPRAAEALSAAERASSAGAVDLITVLLARQRALRAERDGLDLRAAHAIAVAALEAAFGPEPDPVPTASNAAEGDRPR